MTIKQPEITWAPENFRFPGGRHVAVVFNVAYEVWSEGKFSGIGPMGNPLPGGAFDDNAFSYGHYGATTGIRRLEKILNRAGVKGTFYVSGALAERAPDRVRSLAEAGHDIAAHGYTQDLIPSTLSDEDDLAYITKTTELLRGVAGAQLKGWISPRATAGVNSIKRFADAGYIWHGDTLDADLPYLQTFEDGAKIVAVPFTVDINDLPHAMRYGRTPRQYVEMFDEFVAQALRNDDDPIIIDVLVHTHCYGRPGGAWAYQELVEKCAGRDDIWVTTRGDIAEWFLQSRG